jgi:hypothetical protein
MVLYGLSVFFGTPKDVQRGRLSFILISCLMLATTLTGGIIAIWTGFRVLYAGGPTGLSYALATLRDSEPNRASITVGEAMNAITITVGDTLMVSPLAYAYRSILTSPLPLDLALLDLVEG